MNQYFHNLIIFFKRLVNIFLIFLTLGCSSLATNSFSPSSAYEDVKYRPVLEKWRKTENVYKDLELKFRASAVLISIEMEESYKDRMTEIYGLSGIADSKILLSKDTISVVVDVFSKNEVFLDLEDKSLWSISLMMREKKVNPLAIHRYRKKEVLLPFFPMSTDWSRYYVIVFKLPYEVLNGYNIKDIFYNNEHQSDILPQQDRSIIFSMNSSEAQTKFVWNY